MLLVLAVLIVLPLYFFRTQKTAYLNRDTKNIAPLSRNKSQPEAGESRSKKSKKKHEKSSDKHRHKKQEPSASGVQQRSVEQDLSEEEQEETAAAQDNPYSALNKLDSSVSKTKENKKKKKPKNKASDGQLQVVPNVKFTEASDQFTKDREDRHELSGQSPDGGEFSVVVGHKNKKAAQRQVITQDLKVGSTGEGQSLRTTVHTHEIDRKNLEGHETKANGTLMVTQGDAKIDVKTTHVVTDSVVVSNSNSNDEVSKKARRKNKKKAANQVAVQGQHASAGLQHSEVLDRDLHADNDTTTVELDKNGGVVTTTVHTSVDWKHQEEKEDQDIAKDDMMQVVGKKRRNKNKNGNGNNAITLAEEHRSSEHVKDVVVLTKDTTKIVDHPPVIVNGGNPAADAAQEALIAALETELDSKSQELEAFKLKLEETSKALAAAKNTITMRANADSTGLQKKLDQNERSVEQLNYTNRMLVAEITRMKEVEKELRKQLGTFA